MTLPDNEESPSDSPPSKRLKLDDSAQESSSSNNIPDLLSFCDDLILEIFSYLEPTDLLSLSQCCQRLHRVVLDRTLWTSVDFRSTRLSVSELRKYVKFFLPSTKFMATKGPWEPPAVRGLWDGGLHFVVWDSEESSVTFTGDLLETIASSAPNLTTLILENHVLDPRDLTWDKFPPRLEHLTLRCCDLIKITTTRSFFKGICEFLPNLKSLDMSETLRFESQSFLALSKCKELQELRVADCPLSDFVPYVSLGTRFGFRALRVVDFRRTWVSDREVSCLNKTPTLQELYLESPSDERAGMLISDLAVTAFGGNLEEWNQMGYLVVLMDGYSDPFMASPLRVIHLCNYQAVTNTSLRHCASCLKGLTNLNVKGTSCTQAGVVEFKSQRPDVLIESDFDLEVEVKPSSSVDNT